MKATIIKAIEHNRYRQELDLDLDDVKAILRHYDDAPTIRFEEDRQRVHIYFGEFNVNFEESDLKYCDILYYGQSAIRVSFYNDKSSVIFDCLKCNISRNDDDFIELSSEDETTKEV